MNTTTLGTLVCADMIIATGNATLPEGYCWDLRPTGDPRVVHVERGRDGKRIAVRVTRLADFLTPAALTRLLEETFRAVETRGF